MTYRIGDTYYCTIDNVDPGARFARAEPDARRGRARGAREGTRKYLAQTRRFPTAT